MPDGVVRHYRPCLLVRFALQTTFWLVECRRKRGLVLLLQRRHYIRHACWSGATLRYACLYSATLSVMHVGFIYSDTHVCKVLLHQARNLVRYKSTSHAYRLGAAHTGCKTYQLPSWTPFWIYQILSDEEMLQGWCLTQESIKSALYMRIPGVCGSQWKFLIFFVINCHFGGNFV